MIVIDKASTFLGVFVETAKLMNINIYVLYGEDYDPMMVKHVCRFLNSSLTIVCNECVTNHATLEGVLVAMYA